MRFDKSFISFKRCNSSNVPKNEMTTLIAINKDEFSKLIISLNLEIIHITQTIDTTYEAKTIAVFLVSFGLSFLLGKLNKFSSVSIISEII
jgi:hypothetical protein